MYLFSVLSLKDFSLPIYSLEDTWSLDIQKYDTHIGPDWMKGHCVPDSSVFLELKADFEPCGPTRGTSRLANATQIEILGRKRWESMGKERHSVAGARGGSGWCLKHV